MLHDPCSRAALLFALVLAGCTAVGDMTAGPGNSRTLGERPDDDDDITGSDDDDIADDDDITGDDDDDDDTTDPGDDDDTVDAGDLATGLDITGVSQNQGVHTWLMQNGQETASGPIVAFRPGLLRVHVAPQADWQAREVVARLRWEPATGPARVSDTVMTPSGSSQDGVYGSTFNFDIAGDEVEPGASYSIELREASSDPPVTGNDDNAAWPNSGTVSVPAEYNGDQLRVHIVPIQYDADGSGRLPDTTASQIAIYTDWMYRVYPTASVEVTVDPNPLVINYNISANGNGWGDLLYEITDVRYDRNIPDDTYVYGTFQPASSFGQYCAGGCVAGLSWRADDPSGVWARASIGLGYPGEGGAGTLIHEVGHAHGRSHAPCSVGQPDPYYPHSGGELGEWGWDLVSSELKHPSDFRDMMGYCSPRWISDYTWEGLFDRVGWVNGNPDVAFAPVPTPWRIIGVNVDGARSLRGTVPIGGVPEGAPITVTLLDASGNVLGTSEGRFKEFSHIDGGTLLLPEPADDVAALIVDGEVLPLTR